MMRTSSILICVVTCVSLSACGPEPDAGGTAGGGEPSTCPDPSTVVEGQTGVMAHVRYLADDALEGRDVASAGERCAAAYIAAEFAEVGLDPAGDDGSWIQTFTVRSGSRLADDNALVVGGEEAPVGEAWTPYGFSGSGRIEASAVYAGSGLSRDSAGAETPEARVSVSGRIAVIEAHSPGLQPHSLQADPHFRASVAQGREAAGVVILLPEGVALPTLDRERRPFVRIPVVAATGALADRIRDAARAGESLRLATAIDAAEGEARNVVAALPGSDPTRAGEWVVVGAHYDHLGYGGDGSLAPDLHAVHNGADDNASGTAALLDVARRLAEGPPPSRPILFVAFSGEERGLLGSAHFVREPTVPLDEAVAMLNMDMVGRLRDNTLTVFGLVSAPEWEAVLRGINEARDAPFRLALLPDGYGPSDHASFYGEGIPVLHFFTNTHTEYHRPVDDWHTLNGDGIERIAALVADVAAAVSGSGTRMAELTPTERAPEAAPADEEERGRGYGPYFGSIPDMTPTDYGVRLSGVRADSPAERAGLRAGDLLVRFGDTEVTDLYAFTYALRDAAPGDRVEVAVEREGQRYTFNVVLGERR